MASNGTVASRIQAIQDLQYQSKHAKPSPKPVRVMTRLTDVLEQGVSVGRGRREQGAFAQPASMPPHDSTEGVKHNHLPPVGQPAHGPGVLGCPESAIESFTSMPSRPSTSHNFRESHHAQESSTYEHSFLRKHRSIEELSSRTSRVELREVRSRLKPVQGRRSDRSGLGSGSRQDSSSVFGELESLIDDALEEQHSTRKSEKNKRLAKISSDEEVTSGTQDEHRTSSKTSASNTASRQSSRQRPSVSGDRNSQRQQLSNAADRTLADRRRSLITDSTMPMSSSDTDRCDYGNTSSGLLSPDEQIRHEVKHATSPPRRTSSMVRDRAAAFERMTSAEDVHVDKGHRYTRRENAAHSGGYSSTATASAYDRQPRTAHRSEDESTPTKAKQGLSDSPSISKTNLRLAPSPTQLDRALSGAHRPRLKSPGQSDQGDEQFRTAPQSEQGSYSRNEVYDTKYQHKEGHRSRERQHDRMQHINEHTKEDSQGLPPNIQDDNKDESMEQDHWQRGNDELSQKHRHEVPSGSFVEERQQSRHSQRLDQREQEAHSNASRHRTLDNESRHAEHERGALHDEMSLPKRSDEKHADEYQHRQHGSGQETVDTAADGHGRKSSGRGSKFWPFNKWRSTSMSEKSSVTSRKNSVAEKTDASSRPSQDNDHDFEGDYFPRVADGTDYKSRTSHSKEDKLDRLDRVDKKFGNPDSPYAVAESGANASHDDSHRDARSTPKAGRQKGRQANEEQIPEHYDHHDRKQLPMPGEMNNYSRTPRLSEKDERSSARARRGSDQASLADRLDQQQYQQRKLDSMSDQRARGNIGDQGKRRDIAQEEEQYHRDMDDRNESRPQDDNSQTYVSYSTDTREERGASNRKQQTSRRLSRASSRASEVRKRGESDRDQEVARNLWRRGLDKLTSQKSQSIERSRDSGLREGGGGSQSQYEDSTRRHLEKPQVEASSFPTEERPTISRQRTLGRRVSEGVQSFERVNDSQATSDAARRRHSHQAPLARENPSQPISPGLLDKSRHAAAALAADDYQRGSEEAHHESEAIRYGQHEKSKHEHAPATLAADDYQRGSEEAHADSDRARYGQHMIEQDPFARLHADFNVTETASAQTPMMARSRRSASVRSFDSSAGSQSRKDRGRQRVRQSGESFSINESGISVRVHINISRSPSRSSLRLRSAEVMESEHEYEHEHHEGGHHIVVRADMIPEDAREGHGDE